MVARVLLCGQSAIKKVHIEEISLTCRRSVLSRRRNESFTFSLSFFFQNTDLQDFQINFEKINDGNSYG